MEDADTWHAYPNLRPWFNKLHLSLFLGYDSGPSGVAPKKSGFYCVRPVYNIGGMGVGARKQWIEHGDVSTVEPGYFWCEWFEGAQHSVTYKVTGRKRKVFTQTSCFEAFREAPEPLFKFSRWVRSNHVYTLPARLRERLIYSMEDFKTVNVETIGDKCIEIHFRDSPDPDCDEFIPVWADTEQKTVDYLRQMGYVWVDSYDDSNGHLRTARLGFFTKQERIC